MYQKYIRHIMAMGDDDLEIFVDDWMARKRKVYVETEVWAGSGDKGRDVACYLTKRRLEGPWHLFQCKQLKSSLSLPSSLRELGKIFYHAAAGEYSLPDEYVFVAPRNVSRPMKELLAAPERLRQVILEGWDEYCAKWIIQNTRVALTPEIKALILGYDFSKVSARDALRMLKDPDAVATMVQFFGHDPGDWRPSNIPVEVQAEEAAYLRQLVSAYSERCKKEFLDVAEVVAHGEHRDHLADQRVRFFQASFFKRYYRDNTPEHMLVDFQDEIYHGVVETYREDAPDALTRVDKVMKQANAVHPSGVLGRHGRVQVRQGICHHFANEHKFVWKR